MRLSYLFLVLLVTSCTSSTKEVFDSIQVGDTLYAPVRDDGKLLALRIGIVTRVPILGKEELRRLNYSRKDTIGFTFSMVDNRELEECLYKSKSLAIGQCVAKETISTEFGAKKLIKFIASPCIQARMLKEENLLKPSADGSYYIEATADHLVNGLKK